MDNATMLGCPEY